MCLLLTRRHHPATKLARAKRIGMIRPEQRVTQHEGSPGVLDPFGAVAKPEERPADHVSDRCLDQRLIGEPVSDQAVRARAHRLP